MTHVAQVLRGEVEAVVLGQGDRSLQRHEASATCGRGEDRCEQSIRQGIPVFERGAVLPKAQADVVLHVEGAVLTWHVRQRTIEQTLDPVVPVGHHDPDALRSPDRITQHVPRFANRSAQQLDPCYGPAPGGVATDDAAGDVELHTASRTGPATVPWT